MKIIIEHRTQIELIAEMLIEFETLEKDDIHDIFNGTWNIEEKRERLRKSVESHKKKPATPPPIPKPSEKPTKSPKSSRPASSVS